MFSLEIIKRFAAITAFQTAVHLCTGTRAGLRNVNNENVVINYKDCALFLNG